MKKPNNFSLLYLGACLLMLLLVGQTSKAQKIRIIATDGVGQDTVILGLRADATNDIDAALGEEELPPYSPSFNFRSVSNAGLIGRDTCVHGIGVGGVRINYHRLVTVTQNDRWKLAFTSDPDNGLAVTFSWTILNAGANGWEMEDGSGNGFGPVDMTTSSSKTYTLNSPDAQYVYVNYYDGLKLRTATPDDIVNAPDAKGKFPKGAFVKQKANSWLQCFTIPGGTGHTTLHIQFSSTVISFTSVGTFTTATNADGKKKDWVLSGGSAGDPVIICVWVNGAKIPKVIYGWDAAKPNSANPITVKPGGGPLLPNPNWFNLLYELYAQGAFPATINTKPAGLVLGQYSADGKTGKGVQHPKYADVYKSLYAKGLFHTAAARCLNGLDPDPVAKPIKGAQKTLPPNKHNNKLLGDAIAFRVNLAMYAKAKVQNAAGIMQILKYKHPGSPYDGMTCSAINDSIDGMLAQCIGQTQTPGELDAAIAEINAAFSGGPILDTVSWSGKLVIKGVKAIGKSGVLYRNSLEAAPEVTLPPVRQEEELTPYAFKLEQNYPNPFNPTTSINFTLPQDGLVTLKVYNILGQEVATLVNHEQMDMGAQEVEFDATALSSGVYYYRLTLDDGAFVAVKKMMLLK